jgi:DNA-binding GntR family transcriptional regulator
VVARTGEARQTANERAYRFVKERVLSGAYPGGELISEGEVSDALRVSRTPVREAFLRLEVEGLLRLYPQRGALVVPVSPSEVQAVLEARLLLEQFAVEKLAQGTQQAREALGGMLAEYLARQQSLAGGEDLQGFLEEDRLFHAGLLETAGNPLLSQFYASLRDRQVRMIADSMLSEPGRRETILSEHKEIAAAVAAGDLDRARSAVRKHLAGTRSALGLRD